MQRASMITRIMRATALALVSAHALAAQARGTLRGSIETGAAAVEQPLVRTGAAYYIAPGAELTAGNFTIGADAVFATGTPTWRSLLGSGYLRTPALHNVRLLATAQGFKTSGLVPTLHGDVAAEWTGNTGAATSLLRVGSGQLRYAGMLWRDAHASASMALSRGRFAFMLGAEATQARRPSSLQAQLGTTGGTTDAFTARTLDFTPRMIWERSRLRADASIALRATEGGISGTRFGPQLAFTLQTSRGLSLFVGGAQRLPDVRAGLPSGRSVLLGMRIEGRRPVSRPGLRTQGGPALLIERGTLMVDAGGAPVSRVELRGDFTKWVTRTCQPRRARYFDCGVTPDAGTWRVAVRINEGAWQHPVNLAPAVDDFGSVEGVLMTGGKP